MTVVKKLIPLYTKEQIQNKVAELGSKIADDYKGEEIICVCVLKGAVFFFTDLVRAIGEKCPELIIDFLRASSYGDGTQTSSVVKITKDVDMDVRGRNVLFIEDVIDSGVTMSKLIPMFRERSAKSVKLCALIDKRERRETSIEIDYAGFVLDRGFIVGYGLDLAEKYRQLPAIYEAVVD